MKAGKLVMLCFQARTDAHVFHLQSRSYSQHMALNMFYDEVIDLIDDYAETFQGKYGLIDSYPSTPIKASSAVELIQGFVDWIAENRKDCYAPEDQDLSSQIDLIAALGHRTIYKLRNLR